MLKVIGYILNPETGLMKAVCEDMGPVPMRWPVSGDSAGLQVIAIESPNKAEENRREAQRARYAKKTDKST